MAAFQKIQILAENNLQPSQNRCQTQQRHKGASKGKKLQPIERFFKIFVCHYGYSCRCTMRLPEGSMVINFRRIWKHPLFMQDLKKPAHYWVLVSSADKADLPICLSKNSAIARYSATLFSNL